MAAKSAKTTVLVELTHPVFADTTETAPLIEAAQWVAAGWVPPASLNKAIESQASTDT